MGLEAPRKQKKDFVILEHKNEGVDTNLHSENKRKKANLIKNPEYDNLKSPENIGPVFVRTLEDKNPPKMYQKDNLSPCAICGSLEVAHKNYGVDCCMSCK